MSVAFDPKDNPKLLDATEETFWREVRQAYEQTTANSDLAITFEKAGKRVAIKHYPQKGHTLLVITERPGGIPQPALIVP